MFCSQFLSPDASAQSCPASCPTGNCIGTGSCPPGVGGQDPVCHYSHPDICANGSSNSGCPSNLQFDGQCCYFWTSPIILDLGGTGFQLTDALRGIAFHVIPGDHSDLFQISWTAPGSSNAWLALDRDGNGLIDDFGELFGNLTPQPEPPPGQQKNGFRALAVFDKPENGGNNDGWISKEDEIYSRLRVWQDTNHDGVSQPWELHTLAAVGVKAISLNYTLSSRIDAFGNEFRYRSVIRNNDDSEVGKTIYDVILLIGKDKTLSASARNLRRNRTQKK